MGLDQFLSTDMKEDFSYLSLLIKEFFSSEHIIERLNLIYKDERISGWEIWLQIEFSHFLATHNSEPEWYRESPLKFDRRKEKEKSYFCPDFLIRKKGWTRESYVALEIKQHPIPASCIRNMRSDIDKVSKMRISELNIRTMWVLGIFKAEPSLDKYTQPAPSICTFIGPTGFAYLLF